MRTKQLIWGLNNTQKFRAIVNGVGFIMKVKDLEDKFVFTTQRVAVWNALSTCARENLSGFGTTYTYYDEKMETTKVDVQVNLL
jgi:hypothetical protein